MATIVSSDDPVAGFSASMFGLPARELVDYMGEAYDRASHYLNDRAREWASQATDAFARIDFDTVMKRAKRTLRELSNVFDTDSVRPLTTVTALQESPQCMMRWLMAEPTTRELYHGGGCAGYDELYVDVQPNSIGADHYDYRRVMDGVVQVQDNGGWHSDSYFENYRDEDDELTDQERFDILRSWGVLKSAIEKGDEDPTSLYNGSL